MGLKFGRHCVPRSYLGGVPDQTLLRKISRFFSFVKWGTSQKIVAQIRNFLLFWRGVTLGPPQTPPPPPVPAEDNVPALEMPAMNET